MKLICGFSVSIENIYSKCKRQIMRQADYEFTVKLEKTYKLIIFSSVIRNLKVFFLRGIYQDIKI